MREKKINIKVKVLGALIKPFGKCEFEYPCRKGDTLLDLLTALKYKESHIKYIVATVNDKKINQEYILQEGDELVIFTVIGGG